MGRPVVPLVYTMRAPEVSDWLLLLLLMELRGGSGCWLLLLLLLTGCGSSSSCVSSCSVAPAAWHGPWSLSRLLAGASTCRQHDDGLKSSRAVILSAMCLWACAAWQMRQPRQPGTATTAAHHGYACVFHDVLQLLRWVRHCQGHSNPPRHPAGPCCCHVPWTRLGIHPNAWAVSACGSWKHTTELTGKLVTGSQELFVAAQHDSKW